jgi:hypothetical protein
MNSVPCEGRYDACNGDTSGKKKRPATHFVHMPTEVWVVMVIDYLVDSILPWYILTCLYIYFLVSSLHQIGS